MGSCISLTQNELVALLMEEEVRILDYYLEQVKGLSNMKNFTYKYKKGRKYQKMYDDLYTSTKEHMRESEFKTWKLIEKRYNDNNPCTH